MRSFPQSFSAGFDYPVFFTRDLFQPAAPLFADTVDRRNERRRHRLLFFIDSGVAEYHPGLADRLAAYTRAHHRRLESAMPPRVVPGGEGIKNDYRLTMEMVDTML
jgi:3-dehydroquinate synthase